MGGWAIASFSTGTEQEINAIHNYKLSLSDLIFIFACIILLFLQLATCKPFRLDSIYRCNMKYCSGVSNMADCRAVFTCLFSTVSRHPRCLLRTLSLSQRLFATSSTHRKENEAENSTNMFEFYHKNPKHLKERSVREIKFDVDQELMIEKEKAERQTPAIEPEKATWSDGCKRVGAIGVKLGMMPLWLKNGQRVPVTLVQVMYRCQMVSLRIV